MNNFVKNGKKKTILNYEDVMDFDIYQNVWMPMGDQKEIDIMRLIDQGRISK